VSDERAPGYPICPVCGEDLAACPYCLHFDEENEDCRHPLARQLFPPADSQALCPEHRSRLRPVRRRAPLHPALRLLLPAGGLFALLFTASLAVSPPPESSPTLVLVVISPYREARVGRPLPIWLEVYNRARQPSPPISVRLPASFLGGFHWSPEDFRPRPQGAELRAGEWRLGFPPVPGREQRLIRLWLTPRGPGRRELTVKLFAGESDLQGQVKVPLRIRPGLKERSR
jgi:hypothetical protein